MRIADVFVDELNVEASVTSRVLERVPEARLGWQPHPRSMSVAQLSLHVATLPGLMTQFLSGDVLDFDSVPNSRRRLRHGQNSSRRSHRVRNRRGRI